MSESEPRKFFRTLRGFLNGYEPDEENYFRFSATLRIFGEGVPFDEISAKLGVAPTSQIAKGQRRSPTAPPARHDAWTYQPAIAETERLERHLDELWNVVRPAVTYLKSLKSRLTVDIFCGYRSNCDTAGFEVPFQSLEIFSALEVPFGVSVIIA